MTTPLLHVENLIMHYRTRQGLVRAVDGVSFDLKAGQSLGLVGESGSGKSSIALTLLRLLPESAEVRAGHVWFDGVDLLPLNDRQMRRYRWNRVSMVFQAAMNALNPVHRVGDQVIEAIRLHFDDVTPEQARQRTADLFNTVGLSVATMDQYPHELSGGMRQRVMIAMALSCNPDLIIADEPTTALDVIVQQRILRRLQQVQSTLGMSMIYISHDIAVITDVSDRIAVIYAGKIVEMADTLSIIERSQHPYTAALVAAFPSIRGPLKPLAPLPGEPPSLIDPPSGCRFHPRCWRATEICRTDVPPLEDAGDGHLRACWHPLDDPESSHER